MLKTKCHKQQRSEWTDIGRKLRETSSSSW